MDEQLLKVFSRLKENGDGMEFIEHLKDKLKDYTQSLYVCDGSRSEYLKGYCCSMAELIKLFETCDDKLRNQATKSKDWL